MNFIQVMDSERRRGKEDRDERVVSECIVVKAQQQIVRLVEMIISRRASKRVTKHACGAEPLMSAVSADQISTSRCDHLASSLPAGLQ